MDVIEIADCVKSLSKKERLILATFEGDSTMPEGAAKLWNAGALEKLIDKGILKWTVAGYELTNFGIPLADYIESLEKGAEAAIESVVDKGNQLASFVKTLVGFEIVESIDGQYGHMGATICDGVLQAGVNYQHTVKPRVEQLIRDYPEAVTTSGFKALIDKKSIGRLLNWKEPSRKANTIKDLVGLFVSHQIENENQLSEWLKVGDNLVVLKAIHGVGDKTVDYFFILVGLQSVAVDRHLKNFLGLSQIGFNDYAEAKEIIQHAAGFLHKDPQVLDHSIWRYMSSKTSVRKRK